MEHVKVNWIMNEEDKWHSFPISNIESIFKEEINGIYIIWQKKPFPNPEKPIKIGQGSIKTELIKNKNNILVTKYKNDYDKLLVTWAEVDQDKIDRVELYLCEQLKPLLGKELSDYEEITINLPF